MFRLVGGPDYYFSTPQDGQLRLQVPLKTQYDRWFERFKLLYPAPPSQLREMVEKAHEALSEAWIDLGRNYQITPNQQQNADEGRRAFEPFFQLLALLGTNGDVIIVPDTNALTSSPDPKQYGGIAETMEFTFLLLPTVLAELDSLKIFARDPDYREKVARVIRRIKGWRRQGRLTEGVTLFKTITVRAIASEPKLDNSLSWLDASNKDDRIIASVLEIQSVRPSATIVLVTSDINLQNKAEAAKMVYAETPK